MRRELVAKTVKKINEQAWREFQEVKDWCPDCIALHFRPRLEEAVGQLGDAVLEQIPRWQRRLIEKALGKGKKK